MLSSPAAAAIAAQLLGVDDFENELYRSIYGTALSLFGDGNPVDSVTVASDLERRGVLDESGGLGLMRSLVDACPNVEHAGKYAQAVKDASTAKKVLRATYDVQEMVRGGNTAPDALLRTLEGSLIRINEEAGKSDFGSIDEVMFDRYERLGSGDPVEPGIPSGFQSIDEIIGGFVGGRLYILAASTGVGKTSLSLAIAQKVSLQGNGSVLLYSMEMSKGEISDRIVSATAGVVSNRIRAGILSEYEYRRTFDAIEAVEKGEMSIDDDATLTFRELRAKTKRFAASRNVALVVVDYLQLMTFDGGKTENRQEEVAKITRNLKKLAMEMNVPMLVISQLNREVDMRRDKTPQLSDLRSSGAIEQDADVVGLLYFDADDTSRTLANLLFDKNRHGPRGTVKLIFAPEFTRFRERASATG
jgi:replicative DNA helicase